MRGDEELPPASNAESRHTRITRHANVRASSPGQAFLNNTDASALRAAFSNIAGSLLPLRLTY